MADTDFENNRRLYDVQQTERHSLEAFGIANEKAFDRAMVDVQTVRVNVEGVEVPILTPLTNLSDRNTELYRRLAEVTNGGPIGDFYYYSHVVPEMTPREEVVSSLRLAIRALAERNGVLVYDCAQTSAERTDAEVYLLLQAMGGVACQHVGGMPRHYHYLMQLGVPKAEGALERLLDFPELYRQAVSEGAIESNESIEVVGTLSDDDCAHIGSYYGRRHELLTHSDATDAGFSPEALRHVLTDPNYTKIIYRVNGQVANLSLAADARDCSWIDQKYLQARHPDHYARKRLLIGIGAISDPNAPVGLARRTFSVFMQLLTYAGGDVVLGIATDDVSNAYIPRMSAEVARRAGLNPRPVEAVNGVAFRSLVLHRSY